MKAIAAALILSTVASVGSAQAISRYDSLGQSCASVQQIVSRERAVLLRYPSKSGNVILYDRYVADDGQCGTGSYAARTSVPTRDNPMCPVYNCRSSSVFNPH
ncbi:hypothetical protein [Rhizobium sp. ICMP 5592]|uniref:hypothetical protein n=1 Tax=Rhizobium sp. ICMP 5592 TaxID=2292445 RepID=UPI0012952219|nr:hypothetical protein [Rhizobium sp. ICMP 5592]MQB45672.1 hypothetical protein [Rhizobium sp. ICMP 5592]